MLNLSCGLEKYSSDGRAWRQVESLHRGVYALHMLEVIQKPLVSVSFVFPVSKKMKFYMLSIFTHTCSLLPGSLTGGWQWKIMHALKLKLSMWMATIHVIMEPGDKRNLYSIAASDKLEVVSYHHLYS